MHRTFLPPSAPFRHISRRQGFTLVEMAVVLIIISTIIGAILLGNNLLRSARLRAVMLEHDRYVAAIENFRQQYKALPGDMAHATRIWGAESTNFTTCANRTTPSTDQRTCDGNGDDSIAPISNSVNERRHEYFRFWQHLSNAGMIDGSYSGINGCTTGGKACYLPGRNAPASELRNMTWAVLDLGASNPLPDYVFRDPATLRYNHIMYYGGPVSTPPNSWMDMPFTPALTARELWNIDRKSDDGLPGSGSIMSLAPVSVNTWGNANACASGTNPATARYNMTQDRVDCVILFRLSY